MERRLKRAKTVTDPWNTGNELAGSVSWGPSAETGFEWQKTVAWRAPALDLVAKLRVLSRSRNFLLRTPRPDLLMLSVLDFKDKDAEKFSRYFITRDGLYKVLHGQIPTESERTHEEDLDEMQEGIVFALDNGFVEPNEEDHATIDKILEIGYLDGVR